MNELDLNVMRAMGWEERMGYLRQRDEKGKYYSTSKEKTLVGHYDGFLFHPINTFEPSTRMDHAIKLIADQNVSITSYDMGKRWLVSFDGPGGDGRYADASADGGTLPEAICNAYIEWKKPKDGTVQSV